MKYWGSNVSLLESPLESIQLARNKTTQAGFKPSKHESYYQQRASN